MARVREFDPEQAIQGATQVFWRHGFADTSLEDIVSETGVSRYGLYGTFGNKKDLLIAAMRHYEKTMSELLLSDLKKPDAGRAAIFNYWQAIQEHAQDESFCDGCLIVNVAAEVAPHDPDIAAEVHRIFDDHAALFANAIRNGQAAGDIDPGIDAEGTGKMLMALCKGLALMARAGADPVTLGSAVEAALAVLGPANRAG